MPLAAAVRTVHLPNRDGVAVDPVPFLVVTGIAFATCYAFGPVYFAALGAGFRASIALTTGVFLAATAVAYYRLVWTARPEFREEVPAARRFRRLVLAIVIGVVALVGLSLPLLVR